MAMLLPLNQSRSQNPHDGERTPIQSPAVQQAWHGCQSPLAGVFEPPMFSTNHPVNMGCQSPMERFFDPRDVRQTSFFLPCQHGLPTLLAAGTTSFASGAALDAGQKGVADGQTGTGISAVAVRGFGCTVLQPGALACPAPVAAPVGIAYAPTPITKPIADPSAASSSESGVVSPSARTTRIAETKRSFHCNYIAKTPQAPQEQTPQTPQAPHFIPRSTKQEAPQEQQWANNAAKRERGRHLAPTAVYVDLSRLKEKSP